MPAGPWGLRGLCLPGGPCGPVLPGGSDLPRIPGLSRCPVFPFGPARQRVSSLADIWFWRIRNSCLNSSLTQRLFAHISVVNYRAKRAFVLKWCLHHLEK